MTALFAHDTRFFRINGEYYATAINKNVLNRYLQTFNSIVVCGREPVSAQSKRVGTIASTDNVKFNNIPDKNAFFIWFNHKDREHIKSLVSSVDFVIARLDSMIGFLAIKYARELKIPYVIELCTDPWDCYVNYGIKGKILAPWITYKTKKEVKRARNVIYVTNEYLQKKYPCIHNTISISNVECLPLQLIAGIKKEKYKNRNIDDKLIIGTAGALLPFKGQRYVVEAMYILKQHGLNNIYYKLAGNGSDLNFLRKLAKKYELENQIEFCGTLNSEEMIDFYDSLDIYIQPSLQEGLPRTVIEAMSRGLCCMGSRTAGIPELLSNSRIFNKKDSKAIAEMLQSISKEDMMEDSRRNFNESKKYEKNILESLRTKYLTDIINQ